MRIKLILFLILFSSSAQAFPVVLGGISQGFVLFVFSFFGVVSVGKRSYVKGALALLVILLIVLFVDKVESNKIKSLSMEHESLSQIDTGYIRDPLLLSTFDDAEKYSKDHNVSYIYLTGDSVKNIEGFNFSFYKDKKKIEKLSSGFERVYLFSNISSLSFHVAEMLKNEGKDVKILEYADLYKKISSLESSDNIKLSSISSNNQSKLSNFDDKNIIVIGGNRIPKSYMYQNSFVLSYLDLFLMSDNEWHDIYDELDKSKSVRVEFIEHVRDIDANKIALYVSEKMNLSDIEYGRAYQMSASPLSLPGDNLITKVFHNSTSRVSPVDLYAMQKSYGSLKLLCFTDNCLERMPSENSVFNTEKIDTENLFYLDRHRLKIKTLTFDKTLPIVIFTENSNTSLLGYQLAREMVNNGYDFRGFSRGIEDYFGGAYMVKGDNGDEQYYYDDLIISPLVDFNVIKYDLLPDSPIFINESILFFIALFLFVISNGNNFLKAASFLSVVAIGFFFNDLFKLHEAAYNSYTINPVIMALIVALIAIVSSKELRKSIKLAMLSLVIMFAMNLSWTVNISPPIDVFYGTILGLYLMKLTMRNLVLSTPDRFGDKYKLTSEFSRNKGIVVNKRGIGLMVLMSLMFNFRYIIRSNHLLDEENKAGGLFDSKVTNLFRLNSDLKSLYDKASERISCDSIQFWIVPYIDYNSTGIAQSCDDDFPLAVSFSEDDAEKVTNGESAHISSFYRNEKLSRKEKQIFKLIRKIENNFNSPIKIEYGVKKTMFFDRYDLLQVRIQRNIHPAYDIDSISEWIKKGSKAIHLENISLSPLSRSVIERLYDHTIFFGKNNAYAVSSKQNEVAISLIKDSISRLSRTRLSGDRIVSVSGIDGLINQVKSDLLEIHHGKLIAKDSEIFSVQKRTYESLFNNGILLEDFELDSEYIKSAPEPEYNGRELIHVVVLYAMAIVKEQLDKYNFDYSVSISSLLNGMSPKVERSKKQKSWIIVDGNFPEKIAEIKDIDRLDKEDTKEFTLIAEHIPSCYMSRVKDFGAVVTRNGSPLCHLADTARFYNIPCKIGVEHYRKHLE